MPSNPTVMRLTLKSISGIAEQSLRKKGRHASGAAPSVRELLGRRSQISLHLCRGSPAEGSKGQTPEVLADSPSDGAERLPCAIEAQSVRVGPRRRAKAGARYGRCLKRSL